MGSSLHLLDVMFIDDMNARQAKLDEWREHRRNLPEPPTLPPMPMARAAEREFMPPFAGADLNALRGKVWEVDDLILADLLANGGADLEDRLLAEFEGYGAYPATAVDLAVQELELCLDDELANLIPGGPPKGLAGIAPDDPLYELSQLIREKGHGRDVC
ncbi:MAG: hypothetical protein EON60_01570 [Alphaproteobacteria bacterium]|nr:MAG: hypothetical protein EON60_01570 [Alphaproteobacteria bacterium]